MTIPKLQPPDVLAWANELAERISDLKRPLDPAYFVWWKDGDFSIRERGDYEKSAKLLFRLTMAQIKNGLSSKQWDGYGMILSKEAGGQLPCQKQ